MDMNESSARASIRQVSIWRTIVPLFLVAAMIGALVLTLFGPQTQPESRDADLCPTKEDISGSTMLLYDFMKPLSKNQASLPSNLLRNVGLLMERNTELRVFSLNETPNAPRTLLKRLCKPYANADLQVETAADKRGTLRECDDLPTQLSSDIREPATAFCAQLESLENSLDQMAPTRWPKERSVQSAYLVEALEDMRLDFHNRPEPHAIYVVSDMMQHAKWYSHLDDSDDSETNWSYKAFAQLMAAQIWGNLEHPDAASKRVEIFYVPRNGLTDQPQVRQAHQRFWHDYFAGWETAFHNLATAPAYSFVPLMNVLTEAELANQERPVLEQRLRQVREDSARFPEREQLQLERERNRQRLVETEQPLAEADDEQSAQGEAQEVPPPVPEVAGSQPPEDQAPGRERAGADEMPSQTEIAEPSKAEEPATPMEQPVAREEPAPSQSNPNQEPALGSAPFACALQPWQDTGNFGPDYPRGGRVNMGSATITVRFEVDAQGTTIDDKVVAVIDESQSERERYFEVFAAEAVSAVQEWQLAFVEPAEEGCARRQTDSVEFKFDHSGRFYPTRNVR